YRDARAVVGPDGLARAEATLRLFPETEWLRAMAEDAARGEHEVLGLSIDSVALIKEGRVEGKRVPVVEEIVELKSVDVVTRPSAGGKFVSVMESDGAEAAESEGSAVDVEEGVMVVREVEERVGGSVTESETETAREGRR